MKIKTIKTYYIKENELRTVPPVNGEYEKIEVADDEEITWNPSAKKWIVKKKKQILIEKKGEELKNLEFQRLQKVLSDYGYKDLGDVQYWHSQDPDDPEPKGLLEWYKAYDDAIWEEIDSLNGKTFEELKDYNPKEVELRIFEQTKSKLPPLED